MAGIRGTNRDWIERGIDKYDLLVRMNDKLDVLLGKISDESFCILDLIAKERVECVATITEDGMTDPCNCKGCIAKWLNARADG